MAGITLAVRVRDARFVARRPSLGAKNVTNTFRFLTRSGALGVSLVV
jgi:hypothetical protein